MAFPTFTINEIKGDLLWWVAHTRPRCEKRLIAYCRREGFPAVLPCLRSSKRYGRKVVEFEKPIFPGYIFFRSLPEYVQKVYQNAHTANVLTVTDQVTFDRQLHDILAALESGCLFAGTVKLRAGAEVRIEKGPLAGMTGRVVKLASHVTVVLSLDFIGQGAAVLVDAADLEVIA